VDTVSVAVIPVLLGGGIPLFPPPADRSNLQLAAHKVYSKTGIVSLEYRVRPPKLARKRAQRVTTRSS
jgi:dihydrofolate reductase